MYPNPNPFRNSIVDLEFLDTVSDIALVKNNALIGSQIAVALSQLM